LFDTQKNLKEWKLAKQQNGCYRRYALLREWLNAGRALPCILQASGA